VFRAFLSRCSWQSVYFGWRPNLLDESDNHVMELAIAANVTIIITNNIRDFRNADLLFPQIRILPPDKFLKEQGHERSDN
jgi:predicted nucleic acid-binding protein